MDDVERKFSLWELAKKWSWQLPHSDCEVTGICRGSLGSTAERVWKSTAWVPCMWRRICPFRLLAPHHSIIDHFHHFSKNTLVPLCSFTLLPPGNPCPAFCLSRPALQTFHVSGIIQSAWCFSWCNMSVFHALRGWVIFHYIWIGHIFI